MVGHSVLSLCPSVEDIMMCDLCIIGLYDRKRQAR